MINHKKEGIRLVIYSLSLLLCLIAINASAKDFGGGIVAGINGSQIDGDNSPGFNKGGIQGGMFITRKFSDKITGQLEVKYIQKGAQNKTTSENMSVYKVLLQYAEFPILARYKLYKDWEGEAGLAPAILLSASEEVGESSRMDQLFKRFDLPWIVGAYYNFKPQIAFNIRLSWSLFPVRNHSDNYSIYLNRGQFNRQLCVGIYYTIK